MGDVEVKVRDIIVRNLGVERASITPSANLTDDLNANSLDVPDLILSVEEAFGIKIPDEKIETIRTVGDLLTFVKSKQQV